MNYSFLISSSVSLLSISWSFAAQHRSSRMANPNKINVHPIEMLLIVSELSRETAGRHAFPEVAIGIERCRREVFLPRKKMICALRIQ